MPRKPADVVQAIKEKVRRVQAARAQPTNKLSTPPVPQPGTWLCDVCGNSTAEAVCPVDGKGKP